MKGGILALDTGLSTGWAAIAKDGTFATGVERWGAKKGESNGPRYHRFRAWLRNQIVCFNVKMVVLESPVRRQKSMAQTLLACGWLAIVQEVVEELDLELATIMASSLKKWATGDGRADKSEMLQLALERWPHDRARWVKRAPKRGEKPVPVDDQVDAVWALNWAVHTHGIDLPPGLKKNGPQGP